MYRNLLASQSESGAEETYLKPSWNREELHFLDGGLNIRFFTISGTDELLFDTLGLTPMGLPDLQFHCRNLEPNEVVIFLRNLAAYLLNTVILLKTAIR